MNSDAITALIVEDDPAARQLSMRALAKCGFACAGASNAAEARELLATQSFDAIVTDLRMPKEHGYSLVLQLLELPDRPVIIVMTGVTAPQLASDLLRRGVDDLQYKPVNFELMAHKLSVLVEIRRSAARSASPVVSSDLRNNGFACSETEAVTLGMASVRPAQNAEDARQLVACACHDETPGGHEAAAFAGEPTHDGEPNDRISPYSLYPEEAEEPNYESGWLAELPADDSRDAGAGVSRSNPSAESVASDAYAPSAVTSEADDDGVASNHALPSAAATHRPLPQPAGAPAGRAENTFSTAVMALAGGSHLMWLVIVSLTIVSVWLWIQLQVIKQGNQVIAALERVGARIERQQNGDVVVRLEAGVPPQGLEQLSQIPKLDALVLADTMVGDEDLKLLCELKKLRSLDLAGTEISDQGLSHLAPLVGLHDLSLEDTKITDEGLEYLLALKKLRRLSLRGTRVTGPGLNKLQESRPDLEIDHATETSSRISK